MTKVGILFLCLCGLAYVTAISTNLLAKTETYEICGGGFDDVCTTLTISRNVYLNKFKLYEGDVKLIETRLSSFDHDLFCSRFCTNAPQMRIDIEDGNIDRLESIMNKHGISYSLSMLNSKHGVARYALVGYGLHK